MKTNNETPLPLNDTAGLQGIAPTLGDTTPLPWAATNCASHISIHRQGWPRDAWQIASVGTQKQDAANAALIVRAVNAHADLEDALLAALPFVEDALNDPCFKPGTVRAVVKQIRAAIAKAQGKEATP